jgi:hypothetical protein
VGSTRVTDARWILFRGNEREGHRHGPNDKVTERPVAVTKIEDRDIQSMKANAVNSNEVSTTRRRV